MSKQPKALIPAHLAHTALLGLVVRLRVPGLVGIPTCLTALMQLGLAGGCSFSNRNAVQTHL